LTIADAPSKPIFGPIRIEEMRQNEELTRHVMKVVADACKHSKGRYSSVSIANGLSSGEMKLWGVLTPPARLEAAAVTRITGDTCEIILAGPSFDDVAPFVPALEKYAKSQNCERMSVTGPQWFSRQLPKEWFVREVRYERTLSDAG